MLASLASLAGGLEECLLEKYFFLSSVSVYVSVSTVLLSCANFGLRLTSDDQCTIYST